MTARRSRASIHPSLLLTLTPEGRRAFVPAVNHRHRSVVAAMHRVASAAGGGGWPLSGGWKGPEARGGAKRAREGALEAARPPAPAMGEVRWRTSEPPATNRGVGFTLGGGSGGSTEGPGESSPPGDRGRLPNTGLDPSTFPVLLAALVGLVDGLPTDAQRVPDLGPGGSIASCSCGQKIARICEVVLGVSDGSECVQGPLGTALRACQVVEGPTDAPACLAALFRTHVNGYCSGAPTGSAPETSTRIDAVICDTAFPDLLLSRVVSAFLNRAGVRYRPTTEKKRPRTVAAAGVVDDIRSN